MLQFITNTESKKTPTEQILEAIDGGCRWIQIRMKETSDEEIKKVFYTIKERAKETLTTIIINDRVELVKELGSEGVAGVHLGKEDMHPAKAREFLGADAIIGVTANTYNEIEAMRHLDIDYVGIGPFADTKTKKNLSPVLGLEGVAEIMIQVKANGIEIPCVAVGGIKIEDVKPLLAVGVNGIAISGAIANSTDIKEAVKTFIKELPLAE